MYQGSITYISVCFYIAVKKKSITTVNYPSLSLRGNALATNPARIDFEIFMEAAQNLYCPDTNPGGAFPLNVAENHLSAASVKNVLSSILKQNDIPDWVMAYTDLLGNSTVREEIARFMGNHLCKCPISSETIGISAGASAIIELSSFVLANPELNSIIAEAPAELFCARQPRGCSSHSCTFLPHVH